MKPMLAQSFGPICEGISTGYTGSVGEAADIFYPEVIFVQQGNKVWFAMGEQSLTESVSEPCEIVESFDQLDLEERVVNGNPVKYVKDGRWVVEGPFQRSGVKNKNGRTYSRKIWERIIADPKSATMEDLRQGGMLGHLEHPADGRMDGNKGAIVTRKLELKKDGVVWGVAELLDTPEGLRLQEYTRKKVRWGVSSRGNGSVGTDGTVNEDDFQLVTFDAVMKPSTPGAYPQLVKWGAQGATKRESEDPKPSGLSEDARERIAQIDEVRSVDVSTLGESEQHRFAAQLLGHLSAVGSLAGSQSLSPDKAAELQDWLTKKLKEVHESLADGASLTIDRVLETLADGDVDESEASVVIRTLQQQVTERAEEAEALRREVEEMQQEVEAARGRVEALRTEIAGLESERDQARAETEDVQLELSRVREQLEIAQETIGELTASEVADDRQEAVEEVIRTNPALEPHRERLTAASDGDGVMELAEVILAEVGSPPPSASVQRNGLPSRGMVVESESRAGSSRPATVTSPGARMAGKALTKMHAPKP
jgi:polyhydroxyalkanoate synthesis regulator phasin